MINNIKEELSNKVEKELNIVINEGRCKNVKVVGKIKKLYDRIFVIEVDNKLLSFSYNDVLTKKIIFK